MTQQGQTTRQLHRVLDELAYGATTTYYVWPTEATAYPFHLMEHILDYQYEAAERGFTSNQLRIRRDNGAEIRFISYRSATLNAFRGIRNINLVFDHACGIQTSARHYAVWQDVEWYLEQDLHARDAMLDRAAWMAQAQAVYDNPIHWVR